MKLILTDGTEFALSHINVMQTRQEEVEDGAAPPSSKRIDIVFADVVDFDAVAAMDHGLLASFTVETAEGNRAFSGYNFDSLNQHISDNSARMTLTVSKA